MKRINNFVLWMFFIIYEEIIFSISVFNSIKSSGYIILLSAMFAVILHLLTSIKRKVSIVLSYIFMIIIIGIFIAQFIYYNIYQAIISFYSATNAAGQILQFSTTILETAINKWYIMILFILPIIGLIILHKKDKVKFENVKLQQKLITIIIGLIAQIIALICIISTNTNEIYSSRNLYYNVNAPTISANKFGILTTMRLDLKRLLFGFEERNTLVTGEGTLVKQENIDREIGNKEIQFNSLDIDWNNLINNETNPNITSIYEYMSKQEPSKKNEYTGMFEGKNLIVFVAEAFTDLAIDENITPTLYKLYSEGFQFDNLYTPLFPVSTADGEYMTDTSLIPKEGTWSLEKVEKNYMPYSYANVFEKLGYSSQAYHNHTATYYNRHKYLKGMGYDLYLAKGNGLEKKMNLNNWPSSDLEMIDVTTSDYLKEWEEKFLTYYMTVSGHLQYTPNGNKIVEKNWNYVETLDYSEKAKGYLASQIELDRAVELLIKRLEEAGKLEDTVILISGDHYPYGLTLDEVNELSKEKRDDTFEKHHSTALIWNSEMKEPIKVEKISSSLDLLPTMLNLFGVEFESRLLMGRDILSDSDSLVIYSNRSFITKYGKYEALTNKFEPFGELDEGFDVDTYIRNINNVIYNKYQMSKLILDNDFYRKLWTALGWEID
ncbi:MAG: LTA synthase family protein [Clostridia bacterium]|nr:LTA synthase family protein [Clostridia bacterium]